MIKLTKILQLTPNEHIIQQLRVLQLKLPAEAKHLTPDALHITLLKTSKDDNRAISTVELSTFGDVDIMTDGSIFVIERQAVIIDGVQKTPAKKAWITLLPTEQQTQLRHLVDCIANTAGVKLSQYEQHRPFHVSLGNLTGSPFDSVGDVSWDEVQK